MNSPIKRDENRLQIFHEGRKRRVYVGELIYDKGKDRYELIYDQKYAHSKNAIPIAPTLDLFKIKHKSEKRKLFPAFVDRIPDRENPAYGDYCKAEGISTKEKNPIVLLGSIGRRGPSSFVFEPVYKADFSAAKIRELRDELKISQQDFANAFDMNRLTLLKIENGKSSDASTLKR